MKVFCRIFGHTWTPETRVPETRWNTTKKMEVLRQAPVGETAILHLDVCVRCGAEREVGARRHDADRADVED
jgi:hypothetical protein